MNFMKLLVITVFGVSTSVHAMEKSSQRDLASRMAGMELAYRLDERHKETKNIVALFDRAWTCRSTGGNKETCEPLFKEFMNSSSKFEKKWKQKVDVKFLTGALELRQRSNKL